MASEEQTDRAPATPATDGRMTDKEKADALIGLLGTLFSWPVLTLIIVFMIRDELPGMADRLLEGPFGIKLAAIDDKLVAIEGTIANTAEQVDRIEQDLVQFRDSPDLTQDMEHEMVSLLDGFIAYLAGVGFPPPDEAVEIEIRPDSSYGGTWYDPADNLISLSVQAASIPEVALREYAHHVLFSIVSDGAWSGTSRDLESGLAFYYPASFSDNPDFGTWNLDNVKVFADVSPAATPAPPRTPWENAETWGGAFWEMRQLLGADRVDRALLAAWTSPGQPRLETLQPADFVQRILEALAQDGGPDAADEVREIFARRGISLPA